MASIVLGAGLGLAGSAMFGPIGGMVGWAAGSMLGSLFASPTQGPRISDKRLQSSQYGSMIPIFWGVGRIAPQIVWDSGLVEHPSSSGKGGGGGQVTYGYTVSFCALICDVEIADVLMIWANGRIIYDGTNGDTLPFVLYKGTEAQMPDPTMESYLGVGFVNAMRGMSHMVFTDLDATPYGNALPSLAILATTNESQDLHRVSSMDISTYYVPDGVDYYDYGNVDMDSDGNIRIGMFSGDGFTGPDAFLAKTQFIGNFGIGLLTFTPTGTLVKTESIVPSATQLTYVEHVVAGFYYGCRNNNDFFFTAVNEFPFFIMGDGRYTWGRLWYKGLNNATGEYFAKCLDPIGNFNDCSQMWAMWGGFAYLLGGASATPGEIKKYDLSIVIDPTTGQPTFPNFSGLGRAVWGWSDTGMAPAQSSFITVATDGTIWVGNQSAGLWHLQDNGDNVVLIKYYASPGLHPVQMLGVYCKDTVTYREETIHGDPYGTNLVLAQITDTLPWPVLATAAYGPSPGGGNGLFWPFTLFNASATGSSSGQGLLWIQNGVFAACAVNGGPVLLSTILADLSQRAKLLPVEYDVSQCTDFVDGYMIGQQMTVRSAIEALQPVYYFDVVDSDVVRFVKRGAQQPIIIDANDLGAFTSGTTPPARIQRQRIDELLLTRLLTTVFIDPDFEYQENSQIAQRMTGRGQNVATLNCPVVLSITKGRQVAETNLYANWVERDKATINLPQKYAWIEPTDVVNLDGDIFKVINVNEQMSLVNTLDLIATSALLWVQGSVGAPGTSVPPTITPAQASDLLLLDIPLIIDPTKELVLPVAMAGHDRPTWVGATLLKSVDGGDTYDQIATDTGPPDTFGVAQDVLPDYFGGNVTDERSRVTIALAPGAKELSSTTKIGLLNWKNLYLVGDEILQARDVTLISPGVYALAGFLRGRFGTQWAMGLHQANERFVVLPTITTVDVPISDYNALRYYQAVTAGSSVGGGTSGGGGSSSGGSGGGTGTGGSGGGSGGSGGAAPPAGALTFPLSWINWTSPVETGAVDDRLVLMFPFTTGSVPSPNGNLPKILATEFGFPPANRFAVLSDQPGSFSPLIDPTTGQPYPAASSSGNTVQIPFVVGPPGSINFGVYPILDFNKQYWFNLRQTTPLGGSTGLIITLTKPGF